MLKMSTRSHGKKRGFKIRCKKPGSEVAPERTATGDAGFSSCKVSHPTRPVSGLEPKNEVTGIVVPVTPLSEPLREMTTCLGSSSHAAPNNF